MEAGDEGLVNFVEVGICCTDEQRGETPGPAPAMASAANPAIKQQAKDKVFREMRRLADVIVNQVELAVGHRGIEPPKYSPHARSGVLPGKGARKHRQDNLRPS